MENMTEQQIVDEVNGKIDDIVKQLRAFYDGRSLDLFDVLSEKCIYNKHRSPVLSRIDEVRTTMDKVIHTLNSVRV